MSINQVAIHSWKSAARKAKREGKQTYTRVSRCRDKKEILARKKQIDKLVDMIVGVK